MNSSEPMKPWYARIWALLLLGVLMFAILLGVVPVGDPDRNDDAVDLSLLAGSIKANDNLSSSSMTSGPDHAMFSARRIALINRSEHRVMHSVARKLAKRLGALPFVDQVDLFQPGEVPAAGGALHDFYIVLELPRFSSRGLLATGRTVEADVQTTVGQNLFRSFNGYRDGNSPPVATLEMDSRLEHRSVAHGYETASARYTQVIDDIEKQIGAGVEKTLRDWAGKYSECPNLPPGLFPGYRPLPPNLPLPENEGLERLLSGSGLMLRNASTWTLETADPSGVLQELHARLAAEGWTLEPKAWNPDIDYPYHFRAMKEARMYEAFEVREGYGPRQPGERVRLALRYSDRMDSAELRPVLETMVADENLPPQTGLCFLNLLAKDQRSRLIESWLDRDGLPLAAKREVARFLGRAGRTDEAAAQLRSLYIATLVAPNGDVNGLNELGEEITGIKPWKPAPPTVAELMESGARQVVSNATVEVDLGETAMFYFAEEEHDEAAVLLGVTVTASAIPEGCYTVAMHYREGPGFSGQGSRSSTPHSLDHPWSGSSSLWLNRMNCEAEATEVGTNRFSIAISTRR